LEDINCEIKIATGRKIGHLIKNNTAVIAVRPRSNEQLFELYRWADVKVVPLKENMHASGITVVQEAVVHGIPVVCSKTGGLEYYFSESEVRYVVVGRHVEIMKALDDLAINQKKTAEMVSRARARFKRFGPNSYTYAKRHVELSRDLLGYHVCPDFSESGYETEVGGDAGAPVT
jgi:glycosyltransferase involved in cell wall biosynthesis